MRTEPTGPTEAHGELVGRQAELAEIAARLDAAREGRSSALVIRGEPGIGKTALLEHAARAATDMTVVRTTGFEAESELAFAGLSQLLGPLLPQIESLPAPQGAALRAALALGPPAPSDPLAVSVATLTLLAAAAGDHGLLGVVDDVHALDAASTQALLFAARRLAAEGVALVFAVRAGMPSPLDRSGLPELAVDRLTDEDARVILQRSPGLAPSVEAAVAATANGNPLALVEIPKLLTPGQLTGREPLPDPLPSGSGIQRAYQRQIDRLSPEARRVLLLVAAGDAETAETLGDRLEREAVEEGEAAGFLVLGDGLRFRHPLMRSAAYWGATEAERRSAHRALAGLLRDGAAPLRRSWHLALAAVGPDERIAAALEDGAADAFNRGAHGSAGRALERAARLTPDPHARARRLVGAAESLQLIGRFEEASALLDEAMALPADVAAKARAYRVRGRGLMWVGSPHAAHAVLAEGATEVEPLDAGAAAVLRAESAQALFPAGYPKRALALAEQARAAAVRVGGEALVTANLAVAQALLLLGDARPSARFVAEARPAAESGDPLMLAHFLNLQASFLAIVGQYEESRAILEQLVGMGRRQGAPGLLPFPLAALAYVDQRTGRWVRALAEASEGVELARQTGQVNYLGFCLCSLAQVEAVLGRGRSCREHVAEAVEISRAMGSDAGLIYSGAAQLLVALGEGAIDEAIVAGEPIARLFEDRGYREPEIAQWHGDLVEAYIRAGRRPDAERLLEIFEELARQTDGAWAHGVAARCRGLLVDDQDFEDQFSAAIRHLAPASMPFEVARSELCIGERRRRARRRADARAPLRAALKTFEGLGARPWADRARAELRACGGRAREQVAAATDELTPHELRVALVVGRGATNREAAAELFVSPKTVDFHLQNVYRKLDVRSRSELAHALAVEDGV